QARIAVARDGVVAAHPVELVERSVRALVGAGGAEPGGDEGVGIVRSAYGFDGDQCVAARSGISHHGARGEIHGDAAGRSRVERIFRTVEAGAAVEDVVAGAAFEDLDRARG